MQRFEKVVSSANFEGSCQYLLGYSEEQICSKHGYLLVIKRVSGKNMILPERLKTLIKHCVHIRPTTEICVITKYELYDNQSPVENVYYLTILK